MLAIISFLLSSKPWKVKQCIVRDANVQESYTEEGEDGVFRGQHRADLPEGGHQRGQTPGASELLSYSIL